MRSVYCYYYHYAHDARRNRRREGKHHFQGHTVTQLLSEWFQTCIHAVWLQGHSSQALNLYENYGTVYMTSGFPDGSVVKNLSANAGDARDAGLIPGWGRFPGGGSGNPLQYSCLENPHGQRSLVGYSPRGCKESATMVWLSMRARTQDWFKE